MKTNILILLLLFTSCASRKVDINKTHVKKDSIVETKTIVTTVKSKQKTDSTNVIVKIDNSETVITPIDSSKTITIDGKTYKNVVLRIKKNKTNTSYTNRKTESIVNNKDSIAVIKVNKKEDTYIKNKTIEKKANYWFIFYWFILFLILFLLYKNRNRFFNIL